MRPEDEPDAGQPDPFAGWRYGGPQAPAEPLTPTAATAAERPRVRRERPSTRVVAILGGGILAALVAVLALTQGAGAPLVSSATPVTRAAYHTSLEPGYQVDMIINETIAGQVESITAHGAFNTGAHPQGSLTLQAPGGISIHEMIVGPDLFMQIPGAAGTALAPTPWVEARLAAVAGGAGFNYSPTGGSNPGQELDLLRGVGQVTTVGSETVRGVPTTRYHAVIDLNRYPSTLAPSLRAAAARSAALLERVTGQSTLAADVWIDASGLVRRLALDLNACSSAGNVAASLTMEFYDFARQPPVTPPPAGEVTDVTSSLASHATSALASQAASSTAQLGC